MIMKEIILREKKISLIKKINIILTFNINLL